MLDKTASQASVQGPRRVAIVHDWLEVYGGAERVIEEMLLLFPDADLHAVVDMLPDHLRHFIGHRPVKTSFIQRLPFARRHFRAYLPLMPIAIEQFDFSGYDLVISSSHAVAKGIITGPDQLHVCYCYSPIRYAWDMQTQYFTETNIDKGTKRLFASLIMHYMRLWDARTTFGVDDFIAISHFIARRIRKVYRRDSRVIYPPVRVDDFELGERKEEFYLTASRHVPYKKIPLVVEAFNAMPDKRLVVVGDGPEFAKVKALAGPNVEVVGHQPGPVLKEYMKRAKAFVYAAEEDFGIVLLEAQASGTPVIAYGRGGALETVRDGETGLLFHRQTWEGLREAVLAFEALPARLSPAGCRRNAMRFSAEVFRESFRMHLQSVWDRHARDMVEAAPAPAVAAEIGSP